MNFGWLSEGTFIAFLLTGQTMAGLIPPPRPGSDGQAQASLIISMDRFRCECNGNVTPTERPEPVA